MHATMQIINPSPIKESNIFYIEIKMFYVYMWLKFH